MSCGLETKMQYNHVENITRQDKIMNAMGPMQNYHIHASDANMSRVIIQEHDAQKVTWDDWIWYSMVTGSVFATMLIDFFVLKFNKNKTKTSLIVPVFGSVQS